MQYIMLIHADENAYAALPKAQAEAGAAAYTAFTKTMSEAGILRAGERLQPTSMTTVVKAKDGKTAVLNGPYVETREQLGGYYVIDVKDIDEAIAWAARCPAMSHGAVEVRPIWTY